ncbi:MAG: lysophospholipase [Spirochaetales bacterium]|nr:lysophospholipase [Spirochaetales bacterium]MCF7938462.1 lysophospholipase [Spirochaetales bacterium]
MLEEKEQFVTASDGKSLFTRRLIPENARALILMLHGISEHSGRYHHVFERFAEKGIGCIAYDQRGHGRSARKTLGDIESMDLVLEDLQMMGENIQRENENTPLFLFGHSLGGMIALRYLSEQNGPFQGAVLSAPMGRIPDNVSPLKIRIAGLVSSLFPRLPMQKLEGSTLTKDEEERERSRQDPLIYQGRIRARTGYETLKALVHTLSRLDQVRLPILLLHGEADLLMPVESSRNLFEKISSEDKTLKLYPDLYHELLMEPEWETIAEDILQWLFARS